MSATLRTAYFVALAFGLGALGRVVLAVASGKAVAESSIEAGNAPSVIRINPSTRRPERIEIAPLQTPRVEPDVATQPRDEPGQPLDAESARRKSIYDLYAAAGRVQEFRKTYDNLPERPIQLSGAQRRALGVAGLATTETREACHARLSVRNVKQFSPLTSQPFQVFAYKLAEDFEVCVGPSTETMGIDRRQLAVVWARSALGRERAARDDVSAALNTFADDWTLRIERKRREMLAFLRDSVVTVEPSDDPVAVYAAGGKAWLLRRGDEPEVDAVLDEMNQRFHAIEAELDAVTR